MRSTLDIILAAKDGQPATEEELRLALAATSSMLGLLERQNRELAEAVLGDGSSPGLKASFALREGESRFRSRKLPPDQYLGPDHTPGTPENKRLREAAFAAVKKATGLDLT